MKNNVFERLVKNDNVILKVNSNNEILRTKEQFIDNMLTIEQATNIEECLVDITRLPAELNTEWSIIRMYCKAIAGINEALFLERVVETVVGTREVDYNKCELLKEQKTQLLADFANYLFK